MRKSAWILVLILSLAVAAFGQDAPAKPKRLAPPSNSAASAKVTRSDARSVFLKMHSLLSKELDLSAGSYKVGIPAGDAPVTRHEVIQELNRLFVLYQPHFKFTPPKVKYDPAMLSVSPADRPIVEKLIKFGALAKQGAVASALVPTLTVRQFGDAVGFFIARMELLTHLPPSRWTPYLNGGRDQ